MAETLTGIKVGVADGDTITVLDERFRQHKIRLSGIDAPERRQDFGNRSKLRKTEGHDTMTTHNFNALLANQRLAFDPAVDVLHFDAAITAGAVKVVGNEDSLGFSYQGKTVWLDLTALAQLSATSVSFGNGSSFWAGDTTHQVRADWYGAAYQALATSTVGNQVWGLGGADFVSTGSGADRIVGNLVLDPLTHVSRVGEIGSPRASTHPTISADGRFVAFSGGWTEFGSTSNSSSDVLVKDMLAGTVVNEHKNSAGTNGSSSSQDPMISADGTVLIFVSPSANLVSGQDGSLYDIFAAQIGGPLIERVSTGTGGTLADNGRSLDPDVSADGRYVVFESDTTNWAPGGLTGTSDIFLKDRQTGELTRISTSLTGGDGNGDSRYAKISADGRLVVFESTASNLTAGDTNGRTDIFVWDRTDGGLTNLSSFDPGTTRNPDNSSYQPDVAYDEGYGGMLVFQTGKALLPEDTNNQLDVYAFSFDGTFHLVSSRADGTAVQLASQDASLSGDGRFVVFTSYSEDLVAGDGNGYGDVFVKDLRTGEIALVSVSAAGSPANQHSRKAEISLGGDWIVFESAATTLAGSTDGNGGSSDVFRVSNPLLRDTLAGGGGDDTYVLSRVDIVVEDANAGTDTVESFIDYALGANLENLTLEEDGTATTGVGNALANALTGNGLNNTLSGHEGNDRLAGGGGNDTLDGGAGADTAVYSGGRAAYSIPGAASGSVSGPDGTDTVSGIERYQFSDQNLAFDLALGQAAGNTVRIIGAAFDMSAADANYKIYVGIGLSMFDAGMSMLQACSEVTQIMGLGNEAFVTRVYTNVVGGAPSDADRDSFVGQLQGGGGTLSQAQLLEMAAGIGLNETNIGLVGLQQNGVAFV